MSRLKPLDPVTLTGEQKRVADEIVAGPRGGLRGPCQAWLRSPGMADPAQKLGEYVRFGSSLPRDLSEMAIIMAGKHWHAGYEFWAHARMAKEAGLDEAIIEAIRTGAEPSFTRDTERILYALVTEFYAENKLSDTTYQRAVDSFGENGLMDIIAAVGYYGLVSMTLNVFEVELPEGVANPLT